MSAFAALSAFSGDDDILAAQKKKLAQEAMQREREAQASAQAFADFKAKAGQSNWADEDDEDDFYSLPVRSAIMTLWTALCRGRRTPCEPGRPADRSSASRSKAKDCRPDWLWPGCSLAVACSCVRDTPCSTPGYPSPSVTLWACLVASQVVPNGGAMPGAAEEANAEEGEQSEEESSEDEDEETEAAGTAGAVPTPPPLAPEFKKKEKPKKAQAELDEVDTLLADLENKTVDQANKGENGMSKAAAKRAKKKAQEAAAKGNDPDADAAATTSAQPVAAAPAEVDVGADDDALSSSTAGKSPEEIKAMMKARAASAAKKKGGKTPSAAQSAAAAAAESKARMAATNKKKKDKSHYNQSP